MPESLNEAAARSAELVDSDSTAEMVVKIAKDYHNRAFENIKLTLNAALDHAKDFAETRVGSEGALKGHGGAILENKFLTVLKGTATEFRAEALEYESECDHDLGVCARVGRHDNGDGICRAVGHASAKTM